MFEMENRGELIEKIEDLVNRKRYTELRDLLLPLEPADIAILADDLDDEKTGEVLLPGASQRTASLPFKL